MFKRGRSQHACANAIFNGFFTSEDILKHKTLMFKTQDSPALVVSVTSGAQQRENHLLSYFVKVNMCIVMNEKFLGV